MAVKLGGELGGGKKQDFPANSEINVTPFVDIMLVLLIVFMIAAPLATVSVKVDLPPSNADPAPNPPNLTFISVQKSGQIFVMDDEVTYFTLITRIDERTKGNREDRLFLRADEEVAYREVMRVMNTLQDAGYYKIALVAEEITD